jgi:6-phosphogluconolactonase (cycloisomerase 2 family)
LKDDQGEKVNYGDKGDSITIVLLKEDGSGVQDMKWVETGLDWIRGMRVSDDGKWLACAGEYGGGLEIYEISGERGEVLNLKAKDDEVKDVNCVLWL